MGSQNAVQRVVVYWHALLKYFPGRRVEIEAVRARRPATICIINRLIPVGGGGLYPAAHFREIVCGTSTRRDQFLGSIHESRFIFPVIIRTAYEFFYPGRSGARVGWPRRRQIVQGNPLGEFSVRDPIGGGTSCVARIDIFADPAFAGRIVVFRYPAPSTLLFVNNSLLAIEQPSDAAALGTRACSSVQPFRRNPQRIGRQRRSCGKHQDNSHNYGAHC